MTEPNYTISPATAAQHARIEDLLDLAFGLDRRTKASYRLREQQTALPGLSFVATSNDPQNDDQLIGTISFWNIFLGDEGTRAILLGPLAVHPAWQKSGIGLALMKTGLAAAKKQGHKLVILVGDAPYYAKLGFKQVPNGQLHMPGPNDPARLLYLPLDDASDTTKDPLQNASGLIRSPSRYRTAPLRSKPGSK